MKNNNKTLAASLALGVSLLGGTLMSQALANGVDGLFQATEVNAPIQVANHGGDHKCGSGSCGGEHSCGAKDEHKCGSDHKCGSEHKCGAKDKGEHKCGSKEADSKCGAGSCGSKTK